MPREIAIIGAGYVGLPLAVAFAEAGKRVVCIDTDAARVAAIGRGESDIEDVPASTLRPLVENGMIEATGDYAAVADAGAIVICVPTPLSENREPDLTIVRSATAMVQPHLRAGQLVVLESTTYPGTTREVLRPILEQGGLEAGDGLHLAMSPERIDPGRTDWTIRTTPKVVGGLTAGLPRARGRPVRELHRDAGAGQLCDAAELTKLLENIFRSVNIALVNELAMLCERCT